jgi:hypothetical protein
VSRPPLAKPARHVRDRNEYDDDLPWLLDVGDRQHVILPYSIDTLGLACARCDMVTKNRRLPELGSARALCEHSPHFRHGGQGGYCNLKTQREYLV